jgi:ferredoxin-NADP reductase
MKAKIVEKREIAEGILYLKFTTDENINFTAGQFFTLTLLHPPYSDSRGNSRFFGFVNSPTQNKIIEMITRIGQSAFKKSLIMLAIGSEVEIGLISGTISLPDDTIKPLVFITQGIGIAPLMSILRLVKEKSLQRNITLIYINKNKATAVFLDELEKYAKENTDFRLISTMTKDQGWTGEKRSIDARFLKEYLPLPTDNLYFITGIPSFVPTVVKLLRDTGIPASQIKFEIFTGY